MGKGRRVTVEQVMELCPCGYDGPNDGENYTVERVTELWAGREALSASDIAALELGAEDRIWALIRMLDEAEQWDFARWNALQVLHLWNAPELVQEYLETGNEAIRAAAWAAARAAAWDAARDAQIARLVQIIEGE